MSDETTTTAPETDEVPTETTEAPTFRTLTPYACAKVCNNELTQMGFPQLPAQMFYTYVKKGYIKGTQDEAGKWSVNEVDLAAWFNGYLTKKRAIAQATAAIAAETTATQATEAE